MKARENTEFQKDWVGVCEVKTGDAVVQFTSVDARKSDNSIKPFPDGKTVLKLNIKDLPKEAQRVIKPKMSPKKFRVRLNSGGDEVKTVTPVSSSFKAKLVGLGPKDDNGVYRLIPKSDVDEETGKEKGHLEFIAIYEITEGVFRGVELPGFYLHYKFEGIPEGLADEGFTRFDTRDTAQATQLHKLQEWAKVHGDILDEPIVWNPDDAEGISNKVLDIYSARHSCQLAIILETLEERALEADREVNIVFSNGYINQVQAVEDYESVDAEDMSDEELDEAVEKIAPKEEKKSTKKSKVNVPVAVDDGDDL